MEISCFCQCFKTCGSFLKCFITILIIPIRIFLVFQIEGVVFVVFQNEHHKYVLMFFQCFKTTWPFLQCFITILKITIHFFQCFKTSGPFFSVLKRPGRFVVFHNDPHNYYFFQCFKTSGPFQQCFKTIIIMSFVIFQCFKTNGPFLQCFKTIIKVVRNFSARCLQS